MPTRPVTVRIATIVLFWALVLVALFALMGAALSPLHAAAQWTPPAPVRFSPLSARSTVVAADGSLLSSLHDGQERVPVPLADVSSNLVHAVLDTEDADFFSHRGIDGRGVARALLTNADQGRVAQGGSTITQQLVKLEMLTPRRNLSRKVREMSLAIRLERQLGKQAILERYLNRVYFGAGAWGVQVAAERFFASDASQLDVAQSALLAGLIRSPRADDPFAHPDAARRRRDEVLHRMVARQHLDPAAAQQLRAAPLPTAPHHHAPDLRDAISDQVVRALADDPHFGATRAERISRLFTGGLTIHTTVDPAMQAAAEHAVASELPDSPYKAAVVAIEPATGYVRALVGRSAPQADGFNLATDGARQAGSSFKVITLAAAIDAGRSPLDHVDATAPCAFDLPGAPPWKVRNYEGDSGGDVTLWDATVHSFNCAYARVVMDLGPDKVVAMANRLGVRRHLDAVPSITLGTEEVSPIEMATVAATLAADGVRHDPSFVTLVDDPQGHVIIDNADGGPGQRVIAPQVARTTTAVLRDVVARGTGVRANIGRPQAGKTGTTELWSDAWFVGYTPDLATTVWMGLPAGRVPMTSVGGINVTGGSYPAAIWSAFASAALASTPPHDFVPPDVAAWGAGGRIGATPAAAPLPPSPSDPSSSSTTETTRKKKKKHGD
jgi:penicillin-binding protein 1A